MLYGVDVSHWQGRIDFDKFITDGKSDFMIAKISQGVNFKDSTRFYNLSRCAEYSVLPGVYHYVTMDKPIQQFDNFAHAYEDSVIDYDGTVIALDIEDNSLIRAGRKETLGIVNELVESIHDEYDTFPILYMSRDFMTKNFRIPGDKCAGWIAAWGTMIDFKRVGGDVNTTIHQYSSNGSVKGINGRVDVNRAWLTPEGWKRIAKPYNE